MLFAVPSPPFSSCFSSSTNSVPGGKGMAPCLAAPTPRDSRRPLMSSSHDNFGFSAAASLPKPRDVHEYPGSQALQREKMEGLLSCGYWTLVTKDEVDGPAAPCASPRFPLGLSLCAPSLLVVFASSLREARLVSRAEMPARGGERRSKVVRGRRAWDWRRHGFRAR